MEGHIQYLFDFSTLDKNMLLTRSAHVHVEHIRRVSPISVPSYYILRFTALAVVSLCFSCRRLLSEA